MSVTSRVNPLKLAKNRKDPGKSARAHSAEGATAAKSCDVNTKKCKEDARKRTMNIIIKPK
jgi:hypothetical protein